MPKKTLVLFLLSVSLMIALAGCGGGGSTPSRTLSNDYYGMEVGAKYSYHTTYTHKINSALSNESNLAVVVYSVDTSSTPGTAIYKVGNQVVGSSNIEGEYVAKIGTNYYGYGTWSNDGSNYPSSSGDLLMSEPITTELSDNILREEPVTVPAGTFPTAYVLEVVAPGEDGGVQTTDYWFVPNIYGFVKKTEDYTLNGVAQSYTETVLTRTQFGVSTTIPTVASLSAMTKSISASAILRPYRKH
jgi:hypothetical protein